MNAADECGGMNAADAGGGCRRRMQEEDAGGGGRRKEDSIKADASCNLGDR